MWLLDPELEDFWYPLTARIVINPVADGNGSLRLIFEVDPRRPDRWLQEPYFTQISNIAVQHRGTTVRVGRHWFILVPLKAAENPASIAVGGETGITRVVPGKVGRNIVASLAGQFDWIEIEPMTEFIERGWRYGGKR
jgi:hypothetical protein